MRKVYQIKDIDCANCALKIEDALKKMDGVEDVHLDFARESLTVQGHVDLNDINHVVTSVEPDVKVYEKDETVDKDEVILTKKEWLIYGLGLMLAVIGFIFNHAFSSNVMEIISIPFFVGSYIIFGYRVLIRAYKNILQGKVFEEHLLMTIATLGAFALGELLEAVAVMLFYRIGEYLQDLSVSRSRKSIKSLIDIKPTIAHKIEREGIIDTTPELLKVGDLIVVRPGEKVPVDGIITDGSSWLDTSSITGESMPRDAFEGKEVLSGSINISGLITIQVMKEYHDSTVQKIMDFVKITR